MTVVYWLLAADPDEYRFPESLYAGHKPNVWPVDRDEESVRRGDLCLIMGAAGKPATGMIYARARVSGRAFSATKPRSRWWSDDYATKVKFLMPIEITDVLPQPLQVSDFNDSGCEFQNLVKDGAFRSRPLQLRERDWQFITRRCTKTSAWRRHWQLLGYVPAFVSLLFIILYGIFGEANRVFFGTLGISPADIGINQAAIVATAGTYAGYLVLTTAAVGIAAFLAARVSGLIADGISRSRRLLVVWRILIEWAMSRRFARTCIVVAGAIVLVGILVYDFGHRDMFNQAGKEGRHGNAGTFLLLAVESSYLGFSLTAIRALLRPSWYLGRRLAQTLAALFALLVLSVSLVLATDFWQHVYVTARNVVDHKPLDGRDTSNEHWLVFSMSPARLVPVGSDPAKLCNGKDLPYYLGGSGPTVYAFVYPSSTARGRLVRLSSTQYVIETGLESPQPCTIQPVTTVPAN